MWVSSRSPVADGKKISTACKDREQHGREDNSVERLPQKWFFTKLPACWPDSPPSSLGLTSRLQRGNGSRVTGERDNRQSWALSSRGCWSRALTGDGWAETNTASPCPPQHCAVYGPTHSAHYLGHRPRLSPPAAPPPPHPAVMGQGRGEAAGPYGEDRWTPTECHRLAGSGQAVGAHEWVAWVGGCCAAGCVLHCYLPHCCACVWHCSVCVWHCRLGTTLLCACVARGPEPADLSVIRVLCCHHPHHAFSHLRHQTPYSILLLCGHNCHQMWPLHKRYGIYPSRVLEGDI